jgi:hypothetical protein
MLQHTLPPGWRLDVSVQEPFPTVALNGIQIEQVVMNLALLVAALTAAPFLLPFLTDLAQGGMTGLQEGGATVFSTDLLGFIAPAPANPVLGRLGLLPDFAARVVPQGFVLSEVLSYLGLLPLGLALWGVARRPRRLFLKPAH